MMVSVYILRSVSCGIHYVGISKSPEKRLRQHNANQSRGTRGKGPWVIVLEEPFPSYKEARRREKFLKSGAGREWIGKQLIFPL